MTNSIRRRVREHKLKLTPGFAAKYSITRVVYFESFQDVQNARSDAAGGRLRVTLSLPPAAFSMTFTRDSSSPSSKGDEVSLQLWGDIILEQLQRRSNVPTGTLYVQSSREPCFVPLAHRRVHNRFIISKAVPHA